MDYLSWKEKWALAGAEGSPCHCHLHWSLPWMHVLNTETVYSLKILVRSLRFINQASVASVKKETGFVVLMTADSENNSRGE